MKIIQTVARAFLMVVLFMVSACKPPIYTLTYHANGGSQPTALTFDGKSDIQIAASIREGYVFEGWYFDDQSFTQRVTSTTFATTPVKDNVDVYAKWSLDSFTLYYVENGAEPMTDRLFEYGAAIEVGDNPTRVGYTFGGWYTDAMLETPFALTLMPARPVTLYAKWLHNNYSMYFDTDEGSTILPQAVPFGLTMNEPIEPTKTGYTFGGWYLNDTFTQAFVEGPMPAHDVTLYAKWNVNSYTLQFLDFDGSVLWSDDVAYQTDLSQLTVTPPSRIGYEHAGWSTVLPTTMPLYNVTLTAVYHQNNYWITYYSNEGTTVDAWSGHYGDPMPAAPVSERLGYELEGWYVDESLTLPYVPTTMPAESLSLYAKWTPISFDIVYHNNGGELSNEITSYTMETLPVTLAEPTRVGYTFEGWYGQSDLTGDSIEMVVWPQLGQLDFYAKWTPLDIEVSYYLLTDVPDGTVFMGEGETIVQVDAGQFTTLLLTSDHRVIGWGYNTFGTLGPSNIDTTIAPSDMTPALLLSENEVPTRVQGGGYNAFVWTSNNRVLMFGSNMYGEFGNGTMDFNPHPYAIDLSANLALQTGEVITQIQNRYSGMVVLTSHHRIFTWGFNDQGRVGDGTTAIRLTPFDVRPSLNLAEGELIIDVDIGNFHTIALSSTGRVFTWGLSNLGQLGNGTFTHSHVPIDITSLITLPSGDRVIDVSAGAAHNVIRTEQGKIFTWGNNATGELATMDLNFSPIPTDVSAQFPLAEGETITMLSVGEYHNALLTSHHRTLLWGGNSYGMQGDGTQVDHLYPVENTSLVSPDVPITFVTTGGYSSMALLADGTLRMWGQNYGRMLDLDGPDYIIVPTTHRFVEPMQLVLTEEIPYGSDWIPSTDVQVGYTFSGWYLDPALTDPYVVAPKDEHPLSLYGRFRETSYTITFQLNGGAFENEDDSIEFTASTLYVMYPTPGRTGYTFEGWYTTPTFEGASAEYYIIETPLADFDVYAKWQINAHELSYAITEDTSHVNKIPLLPDEVIDNIEYGSNFVVVLTTTGRVFTWGSNTVGQLGNGTFVDASSPQDITHQFVLWSDDYIEEIATGSGFTIARSHRGRVFTWGFNNIAQLGNGTTTHGNRPTDITSRMYLDYDETITAIYAGGGSGFAVTSYGRFLIWGSNISGELGDNLTSSTRQYPYDNTPALGLQEGETIVSFSSKGSHTLLITSNHRLIGWGKNTGGQLGSATPTTVRVPTDLTSKFSLALGEFVIAVATGERFSLVATNHQRVFTMGLNYNGELGNGTIVDSTTPVAIQSFMGLNLTEVITQAAFGYAHVLTLTSEGRLLGWGRNWAGEIGDLTTTTRLQAVDVTSSIPLLAGETITALDAQFHISAVTTTLGRVIMWGNNSAYQQLNGGIADVLTPHAIETIDFVTHVPTASVDYATLLDATLPTREGYTFSGWYTDLTLTTAWTGTTMPDHPLHLFGRWIINP